MSKNLLHFLILVASFAMYYLVINPLYTGVGAVWQPEQGIVGLRDTSAKYDTALTQVKNLSIQADALQKQYEKVLPETKQKMGIMVPDKVDPIRLISEVNNTANQAGLVISGLNYSENPLVDSVSGSYVVSFSVTTSYAKFKEFIRNYETSLRLFTIKSVEFGSPTKEGENPSFKVKLETFYMK